MPSQNGHVEPNDSRPVFFFDIDNCVCVECIVSACRTDNCLSASCRGNHDMTRLTLTLDPSLNSSTLEVRLAVSGG